MRVGCCWSKPYTSKLPVSRPITISLMPSFVKSMPEYIALIAPAHYGVRLRLQYGGEWGAKQKHWLPSLSKASPSLSFKIDAVMAPGGNELFFLVGNIGNRQQHQYMLVKSAMSQLDKGCHERAAKDVMVLPLCWLGFNTKPCFTV